MDEDIAGAEPDVDRCAAEIAAMCLKLRRQVDELIECAEYLVGAEIKRELKL